MRKSFAQVTLAAMLATGFTGATLAAQVSKHDKKFFEKAAIGGMYEVEVAKLAESKGGPQVKSYGEMLVKDHGAANDELKQLAQKKGVTLPATLPKDKQKKIDKLAKEKKFDKEFVEEVGLDDHKEDIALFEKASKSADDSDVKAYAAKTLPTLKQHLEHAQGLKKAM